MLPSNFMNMNTRSALQPLRTRSFRPGRASGGIETDARREDSKAREELVDRRRVQEKMKEGNAKEEPDAAASRRQDRSKDVECRDRNQEEFADADVPRRSSLVALLLPVATTVLAKNVLRENTWDVISRKEISVGMDVSECFERPDDSTRHGVREGAGIGIPRRSSRRTSTRSFKVRFEKGEDETIEESRLRPLLQI